MSFVLYISISLIYFYCNTAFSFNCSTNFTLLYISYTNVYILFQPWIKQNKPKQNKNKTSEILRKNKTSVKLHKNKTLNKNKSEMLHKNKTPNKNKTSEMLQKNKTEQTNKIYYTAMHTRLLNQWDCTVFHVIFIVHFNFFNYRKLFLVVIVKNKQHWFANMFQKLASCLHRHYFEECLKQNNIVWTPLSFIVLTKNTERFLKI